MPPSNVTNDLPATALPNKPLSLLFPSSAGIPAEIVTMDTTFSDDEKRFVLGEIIKVSAIDASILVDFIKTHKVEPNWMKMQLPGGRNMSQCVGAVENMFQMKFTPPNIESLGKRKSLGDLNDHPAKRPAITTPFETPLAPVRPIQPRLLLANGYPPLAPITSTPTVSTTGKKRGRPSKADKEAQARAAHPRNTEYAPIVPAPPAPPTATPTGQLQREYVSSPGLSCVHYRDARALPEPMEQIERTNMSPRDNNSAPVDSRSPPLAPLIQDQPQTHSHILPRPPQAPPIPIQPSPRPPQAYEPYRGPDPIFPDRDRSRSMPDQVSRNASASPVVSRI
ncbi:hypothetical protein CHU98_g5400 [Xylaria longipes]|nr:hypothetical protein CHU98_g5400 [Xylaria longipes]